LRVLDCDPVFEAREQSEIHTSDLGSFSGRNDVGHPQISGLDCTDRICEVWRHDADDLHVAVIRRQPFSKDVWRTSETALPEAVTDDRHAVAALGLVRAGKHPAHERAGAQDRKELGRHALAAENLGVAPVLTPQSQRSVPDRGQTLEGVPVGAEGQELHRRKRTVHHSAGNRAIECQEPIGPFEGERSEHDVVDE
jgi:hypothetical protein